MQYLDEYREAGVARALAARIHSRVTRHWTVMNCGVGRKTLLFRRSMSSTPSQALRWRSGDDWHHASLPRYAYLRANERV